MPRDLPSISADFDRLSERDFNLNHDDANGIEKLRKLTGELKDLNRPAEACEVILHFIERLSRSAEIDPRWDLGSPGPLVHTLERLPGYEEHVIQSAMRSPAPLALWVINRMLNAKKDGEVRARLLDVLKRTVSNPDASEASRTEAAEFLRYQGAR